MKVGLRCLRSMDIEHLESEYTTPDISSRDDGTIYCRCTSESEKVAGLRHEYNHVVLSGVAHPSLAFSSS